MPLFFADIYKIVYIQKFPHGKFAKINRAKALSLMRDKEPLFSTFYHFPDRPSPDLSVPVRTAFALIP